MDLSIYLNKKVQIILNTRFTYIGVVIDCDANSITIIDKTGSKVCLKEDSIQLIKEMNG
jgi:small nuclear ribonucleoprotein (snRNP)-like protein